MLKSVLLQRCGKTSVCRKGGYNWITVENFNQLILDSEESRGVGGIFFDDFEEVSPDYSFDFVSVSFLFCTFEFTCALTFSQRYLN